VAGDPKAMQVGRRQSNAVDVYLVSLDVEKVRGRGSRPMLERRLVDLDRQIEEAPSPHDRVIRIQRRMDVVAALSGMTDPDPDELRRIEDAFVAAVGPYSERHRISYAAWRAVGVPAAVLRRAGFTTPGRNGSEPVAVEEPPPKSRSKSRTPGAG